MVPDEACRTPRLARTGTGALIKEWCAAARRLRTAAAAIVEIGSPEWVTRGRVAVGACAAGANHLTRTLDAYACRPCPGISGARPGDAMTVRIVIAAVVILIFMTLGLFLPPAANVCMASFWC